MYGNGVAKDETEAVKWLRKSAEQNNPGGEFWLGAAYSAGLGVAKDEAEAVRWYTKAAEQGFVPAQYNVGQAYYLGNGVAKNTADAARWWQKAAEQGFAKAQYNLGYHSGDGAKKDDVEAYFWINIAASFLDQPSVKQSRENIGKMLTAAQLSEVQERCRKWERPIRTPKSEPLCLVKNRDYTHCG